MGGNNILPSADECDYASCYCEENVWKLCRRLQEEEDHHLQSASAVFISNSGRSVPLWSQKSGRGAEKVVLGSLLFSFIIHL